MGEAKRRGTFEERLKLAQEREKFNRLDGGFKTNHVYAFASKQGRGKSKIPMLAATLALASLGLASLPRD